MSVSVCMASHNGGHYIREQVISILDELGPHDELIIVDDHSTDNTAEVINDIRDSRIQLHQKKSQQGHVARFAEAIALARGEIIMLSDQDDIWCPGRYQKIVNALGPSAISLSAGNFDLIYAQGKPLSVPTRILKKSDAKHRYKNIAGIFLGRRPYFGCAMAFKKSLIPCLLPIPKFVESHDLWIAMAANVVAKVEHIEDSLLLKRVHRDNVSTPKRRPLPIVILSRVKFLIGLIVILWRAKVQRLGSAE